MTACHNINDIAPEILSVCTGNNIIYVFIKRMDRYLMKSNTSLFSVFKILKYIILDSECYKMASINFKNL